MVGIRQPLIPKYACVPTSGDIDGNGKVDLRDAILALQILTNMSPAGIRADVSAVDVNGDGRIGIPEVIYLLQEIAGER